MAATPDAPGDDLPAYYARRAPAYDRVYDKPERQADLAWLRRLLATHFAGEHLLEVACGTGYWTQVIAPAAASVLALDAAAPPLDIARARVPLPQLRFAQADAYALPPPDRPYTAAFAGFWWSHVPRARQAAFLRGLHAVLAPGARVCLLDNRYVAGSSTPLADTDADGNTYQWRRLDDGSTVRVLKNFPDAQALQATVAAHGGGDIRYTALTYFWLLDYRFVGP